MNIKHDASREILLRRSGKGFRDDRFIPFDTYYAKSMSVALVADGSRKDGLEYDPSAIKINIQLPKDPAQMEALIVNALGEWHERRYPYPDHLPKPSETVTYDQLKQKAIALADEWKTGSILVPYSEIPSVADADAILETLRISLKDFAPEQRKKLKFMISSYDREGLRAGRVYLDAHNFKKTPAELTVFIAGALKELETKPQTPFLDIYTNEQERAQLAKTLGIDDIFIPAKLEPKVAEPILEALSKALASFKPEDKKNFRIHINASAAGFINDKNYLYVSDRTTEGAKRQIDTALSRLRLNRRSTEFKSAHPQLGGFAVDAAIYSDAIIDTLEAAFAKLQLKPADLHALKIEIDNTGTHFGGKYYDHQDFLHLSPEAKPEEIQKIITDSLPHLLLKKKAEDYAAQLGFNHISLDELSIDQLNTVLDQLKKVFGNPASRTYTKADDVSIGIEPSRPLGLSYYTGSTNLIPKLINIHPNMTDADLKKTVDATVLALRKAGSK